MAYALFKVQCSKFKDRQLSCSSGSKGSNSSNRLEMRNKRRYLHWIFEAKKRFGFSVLTSPTKDQMKVSGANVSWHCQVTTALQIPQSITPSIAKSLFFPEMRREQKMRLGKSQPDLLFRAFLFAFLIALFDPDYAIPQTSFYKGKTITFINGVGPGGTGDLRGKPIAAFLTRHIPGNPTIVTEYMPGAGGRKAANHMYSVARPDGLTIARISSSMVPNAVLGETGVQYDLDKLIYLGSAESVFHFVLFTRKDAGLNNLEKLRGTPGVRIAAGPVGHSTYYLPRVFAYLIGMKEPRIVPGYSGAETDVALTRGELDLSVESTGSVKPEWIQKGLIDFHVVLEIPKGRKFPGFTHLPELDSFVKSEKERKLLAMVRAFRQTGAPWIVPPNTPKERVQTLQVAMRKTFADPDFHSEYKKIAGDDATPLLPEELEKVIRELPRDSEIVELFKKFLGGGPLPSR